MQNNCPFEIKPYANSNTIKNEKILNLNYTNQDFWSMKTRLVQFIQERFGDNGTVLPNTFNDLVEGSIAIMLMENWAFIADTLSFKMDQMVNELFIDTVTEPDNAFRICQLVGFKPTPPIPASSMWTATINAPLSLDLTIDAPVSIDIASEDGLIGIELFPADSKNNPVFDQDIIIPSGMTVNSSIVGLEGRTFTDNFTGTGQTLQSVVTSKSPVIYDSISVRVDGILWERVDYFSDSQPRREYRVEFDSSYGAYIMFGNNRAGLSPAQGAQIEVRARTGGGTRGNIVTGYVEYQSQAQVFGISSNIPVTFKNYTKGDFGYNGDNIEDIRRKLPSYLRTQDRAVTGLDYKHLTDQFVTPYHGQIGKSTAALRNHGCAGNVVDIYILARDGSNGLQEANDSLKAELAEMMELKKMITDYICIKDGTIVNVDVNMSVTMDKFYRKFEDELRVKILNRVSAFFNIHRWEFGQNLKDTDITKELSDLKEIQRVDVTFNTDQAVPASSLVTVKFFEIIRDDIIDLGFIYE